MLGAQKERNPLAKTSCKLLKQLYVMNEQNQNKRSVEKPSI
jgi:hypothetical protein